MVPSLKALAARVLSGFNIALGTTNGRPHVISALSNIDGQKAQDVMAKHAGSTDQPSEMLSKALEHVPSALDKLYHAMGTTDKIGTIDPEIHFSRCDRMYLGSSSGQFTEFFETIKLESEFQPMSMYKQASQKKIHSCYAVMNSLVDFYSGEAPIDSLFVTNLKNEHYFSVGEKQETQETWDKWIAKARSYEIANDFFYKE